MHQSNKFNTLALALGLSLSRTRKRTYSHTFLHLTKLLVCTLFGCILRLLLISSSFFFLISLSLALTRMAYFSVSFTLNTTAFWIVMPTLIYSCMYRQLHYTYKSHNIFPLQVAIPFCALIDSFAILFRFRYFIWRKLIANKHVIIRWLLCAAQIIQIPP